MRLRHRFAALGGALLLGLASTGAGAEITYQQRSLLAASCATCHGTEGRLDGTLRPLAGQSYEVLRAQLLAFRADENPHATVMNRIAAGYSEAELEAIARYFAELTD